MIERDKILSKLLEGESGPNPGEIAKYTMLVTVKLTGVMAHRIRRFETCGLCRPARTESGHRLYSDVEIELIKEIATLEAEGVNLSGIKVILRMRRNGRE